MKFSIITPEHTIENRKFLLELYESILAQTYENWEWVIYVNNGLCIKDIPKKIRKNKKVKVYEDTGNNYIGRIKHEAFFRGTGDILVEVDHDDVLIENCLQRLFDVYSSDEEIGFVFSDNLKYSMYEEFVPYGSAWGWTHYKTSWKDKELICMNSFPVSGKSIRAISWAPDHVRTWRRDVYELIDGHNPSLTVCDDLDLIQRTFLVTKMEFIPEPLYVYRITGENSWLQRLEEIDRINNELFYENVRALAERDAELNNKMCIDIGGGLFPYDKDRYTVVDKLPSAEIVCDLNEGIPLEDNSVGVINAHHILEHLKDPIHIMEEIYRVLYHGGWAFIEVPSTDGRGAFQDPTHRSFWNINSFQYYTESNKAVFIDSKCRFQTILLKDYYPSPQMEEDNILVTCAVLVAIKNDEERFPGLLEI